MELKLGQFMKEFTGKILINNSYIASTRELKEAIDNRVVRVKYNTKNKSWIIELNECIVDNTHLLEVVGIQ